MLCILLLLQSRAHPHDASAIWSDAAAHLQVLCISALLQGYSSTLS